MQRNSQSANLPDPETQTQSGVVFHVHNIAKVYRMGEVEVRVLRSIDLDLYEGEFMVLLGASGSGKSTEISLGSLGTGKSRIGHDDGGNYAQCGDCSDGRSSSDDAEW
jgi:ABC-type glutathione transport system ATPase component